MPAVDLHQEKRREERTRAPKADMKVGHFRQPLEHEWEPEDKSVLCDIGEEGQTCEMADEGRPQSITETGFRGAGRSLPLECPQQPIASPRTQPCGIGRAVGKEE